MHWIENYQLFLFDFDGLLVNTEEIHFLAYQRMCKERGFDLDWSFPRYCRSAHYSADALKEDIYAKFPKLQEMEPDWSVLYAEKKKAIMELLHEGAVHLMPGVEVFLKALQEKGVKRCVVTHSPDELVNLVRKKNPILDSIPNWITRHDYAHPKPNPECYLKAIALFANPGDRVIGFEDTPRGLQALMGTAAKPVLVCRADYPEIPDFVNKGVVHIPSFENISI